jgi:nucleoside phosphorylase
MDTPHLKHDDYTVGLICALPQELTAARAMLDETHTDIPQPPTDPNTYCLGRICDHNIVIACLPKGEIGNNPAVTVATLMLSSFPQIRFGLMVGIGGGVPSMDHDIRLGDVVVSTPTGRHGGVVQWDMGKTTGGGHFERTGSLNSPPMVLKTALTKLESTHEMRGSKVPEHLSSMMVKYPNLSSKFTRPAATDDVLFEADYDHVGIGTCNACDPEKIVPRQPRASFAVHYGIIASGNQVMKHGATRDKISKDLGGVLCFEMETAGLMNGFPCLAIRGICDYADSHKSKQWQGHAAATAAAFAKELLNFIPANQVDNAPRAGDVMKELARAVRTAQRIESGVIST